MAHMEMYDIVSSTQAKESQRIDSGRRVHVAEEKPWMKCDFSEDPVALESEDDHDELDRPSSSSGRKHSPMFAQHRLSPLPSLAGSDHTASSRLDSLAAHRPRRDVRHGRPARESESSVFGSSSPPERRRDGMERTPENRHLPSASPPDRGGGGEAAQYPRSPRHQSPASSRRHSDMPVRGGRRLHAKPSPPSMTPDTGAVRVSPPSGSLPQVRSRRRGIDPMPVLGGSSSRRDLSSASPRTVIGGSESEPDLEAENGRLAAELELAQAKIVDLVYKNAASTNPPADEDELVALREQVARAEKTLHQERRRLEGEISMATAAVELMREDERLARERREQEAHLKETARANERENDAKRMEAMRATEAARVEAAVAEAVARAAAELVAKEEIIAQLETERASLATEMAAIEGAKGRALATAQESEDIAAHLQQKVAELEESLQQSRRVEEEKDAMGNSLASAREQVAEAERMAAGAVRAADMRATQAEAKALAAEAKATQAQAKATEAEAKAKEAAAAAEQRAMEAARKAASVVEDALKRVQTAEEESARALSHTQAAVGAVEAAERWKDAANSETAAAVLAAEARAAEAEKHAEEAIKEAAQQVAQAEASAHVARLDELTRAGGTSEELQDLKRQLARYEELATRAKQEAGVEVEHLKRELLQQREAAGAEVEGLTRQVARAEEERRAAVEALAKAEGGKLVDNVQPRRTENEQRVSAEEGHAEGEQRGAAVGSRACVDAGADVVDVSTVEHRVIAAGGAAVEDCPRCTQYLADLVALKDTFSSNRKDWSKENAVWAQEKLMLEQQNVELKLLLGNGGSGNFDVHFEESMREELREAVEAIVVLTTERNDAQRELKELQGEIIQLRARDRGSLDTIARLREDLEESQLLNSLLEEAVRKEKGKSALQKMREVTSEAKRKTTTTASKFKLRAAASMTSQEETIERKRREEMELEIQEANRKATLLEEELNAIKQKVGDRERGAEGDQRDLDSFVQASKRRIPEEVFLVFLSKLQSRRVADDNDSVAGIVEPFLSSSELKELTRLLHATTTRRAEDANTLNLELVLSRAAARDSNTSSRIRGLLTAGEDDFPSVIQMIIDSYEEELATARRQAEDALSLRTVEGMVREESDQSAQAKADETSHTVRLLREEVQELQERLATSEASRLATLRNLETARFPVQ